MHMSTSPEGGGTGVDIVDRVKGRTTLALLFGLIKFRMDENDMNFYEAAYKDGPVRLLRSFQVIISLPLGYKAPGVAVEIIWYDTMINVPMVFRRIGCFDDAAGPDPGVQVKPPRFYPQAPGSRGCACSL